MNLPGVMIMISGFVARLSNCPSKPCPPTIKEWVKSVNRVNSFRAWTVCIASSLVGTIIKALDPTMFEWDFSLFTNGIRKAPVLPDPVLEQATISDPSKIKGMAFF